jgi:hypothetical protein
MSGFINDKESLANGIPARHIGPETGSFGNATVTNRGDTSEGTNESFDSAPPPAAGIGATALDTTDMDDETREAARLAEERAIEGGYRRDPATGRPVTDEDESIAQQIADGGDHYKHGKKLHDR